LIVEGFRLMMIERPAVLTPEELAALFETALEIDLGAASGAGSFDGGTGRQSVFKRSGWRLCPRRKPPPAFC
jgi:hypothetical protein